jgi:hypothetical protein
MAFSTPGFRFSLVRLQTNFQACYIHWLDGTKAKRNAICPGSSGAAASEEQQFGCEDCLAVGCFDSLTGVKNFFIISLLC